MDQEMREVITDFRKDMAIKELERQIFFDNNVEESTEDKQLQGIVFSSDLCNLS
jgi:hypothetical protein